MLYAELGQALKEALVLDEYQYKSKSVLTEDYESNPQPGSYEPGSALSTDEAYKILYNYFSNFETSDLIDIMINRGWLPEDITDEELQPLYDDGAIEDILYHIEHDGDPGELEAWALEVLNEEEEDW